MKVDRGRPIMLPLLACLLVLGIGAASHAKEEAGWLGVMLQDLTDEIKEAMELDTDLQGVLISDVIDDSPAEEYGLEDGDIIIMIGDEKVITMEGAIGAVKSRSPGEKVEIVVLRDGDKKKIQVALGERPAEYDVEKKIQMFDFQMPDIGRGFGHMMETEQAFLGVRVQEISSDLGDYFGVDAREGVLVLDVVEDSPAEDAELKDGDVILKIDGKDITSPDKLVKYIRKSEPGEEVEVTYKRKNRTRTVTVELGEAPGDGMSYMGEGQGKHVCCGRWIPDHKRMKEFMGMGKGGHKYIIKYPGTCMKKIHIPDIDIEIPDLDDLDLEELEDIEVYHLEADDLKEEMEELHKEIEKLKKELEKLKK